MNWKTRDAMAGQADKLLPFSSTVECTVIRPMINGKVADTYRGREVVQFQISNAWGLQVKSQNPRLLTLHHGILNQCSLDNPPTPYWAVLDAASDLKHGFQKRDVINLAVKAVGESKRRACEMAWDVLRNHHRHARKKTSGMSHMIDSTADGQLLIRGRGAEETVAYFEAEGERAADAAKVMKEVAAVAEVVEV